MYCGKCGAKLPENASFCGACGAQNGAPSLPDTQAFGSRIALGPDGVYRWVYEMSLFKNLTFYFLIWKIFFFIILGIFAFVTIVDAISRGAENLVANLPFFGYFIIGMTVVTALGYLIYAAIMGGKYTVEFEMDENGVIHRQTDSQAKKAKAIGTAAAIGGIASGRLSTVGAGIGAQRTSMYSAFSKVRKVKAYPKKGLIKVNAPFRYNQVYTAKEDFAFVHGYIVSHCPNLKH